MKPLRHFAIVITILFSCSVLLAGEIFTDFENLSKTAIGMSAHGVLATDKEAPLCLALDVSALIFDVFFAIRKNVVDEEKLQVISKMRDSINPDIYSCIKQGRFNAFPEIQPHPFAQMSVAQFKDVAFEYFKQRFFIDKLTKTINEINNDEIPTVIITTIKSIADKDLFIDMVNFWKTASTGLPTDPNKAKVTCSIQ